MIMLMPIIMTTKMMMMMIRVEGASWCWCIGGWAIPLCCIGSLHTAHYKIIIVIIFISYVAFLDIKHCHRPTICILLILRFLVYQNTALFSTFLRHSSVCHRRDISTFLDNLMVWIMKTIYFLNAYHPGWSSWPYGSPGTLLPPWPNDHLDHLDHLDSPVKSITAQ